jgi:hypothetical protein
MDFWENIAANLFSDFFFILITIILGWGVFILSKRTRLLRFFGINSDRRLVVYLSDLRLESGQTFGIDDKRRMYAGSAVAFGEMQAANRFRDLFNYFLPSLSEAPNFLSKLLISDVQTQIQRSPPNIGQVEQSASFITFGSPAYNWASTFVEERLHSKAKFILGKDSTVIPSYPPYPDKPIKPMGLVDIDDSPSSVPSGSFAQDVTQFLTSGSVGEARSNYPSSGDKLSENPLKSIRPIDSVESPTSIVVEGVPHLTETTYGFVERIVDHEQNRIVFYVAGISELSTVGAANFLITEWEKLQRKYGNDKGFLVMLKFESTDFRRWNIIFEK